jgi:hypothetical protein
MSKQIRILIHTRFCFSVLRPDAGDQESESVRGLATARQSGQEEEKVLHPLRQSTL